MDAGETTLKACWNHPCPSRPYSSFFAAVIGVIVFVALSQALLDPHD
jgi:hypothetical protein